MLGPYKFVFVVLFLPVSFKQVLTSNLLTSPSAQRTILSIQKHLYVPFISKASSSRWGIFLSHFPPSIRDMSCRPLPAWEVSAVRQVWELWCCLLLLLPWESLSLMEEILSQVMHSCESRPSFTCMFVSLLTLGEFPLLSWSKICTPLASSDSTWTLRVWMNIFFWCCPQIT